MKRFFYKKILTFPGFIIIILLSLTYRIRITGRDNEESVYNNDNYPIYASWHQRFFPGIRLLGSRKPAIIISRSKDGDLISNIIKHMGWRPVRGSSSRGGMQAIREIKKLTAAGCPIGHIVDGPRGPAERVKPGIITIARLSGMPIIPTIISPEKRWIFKSWDRFMLPKPFSKIIVKFEKPIFIPRKMDKENAETCRKSLEERLAKGYGEADRIWD